MVGNNKHENALIRKRFRKGDIYRCCYAPKGNHYKYSSKMCCTYPHVYKRYDVKIQSKQMSYYMNDDIVFYKY